MVARFSCFVSLVALLLCTGASVTLRAQPQLLITRVSTDWPRVEIDIAARCDGALQSGFDASAFTLTEDGVPVTDFTVDCPPHDQQCTTVVALLFDVSGSMLGPGIDGAKLAGHRYIDEMRYALDETAVIAFSSTVRAWQPTTRYKPLLHNAVDSLVAGGATALWDGLHAAVLEAAGRTNADARAVIVLSDGQDNASQRTPAEVRDLALRHDVRIFAAHLGGSTYADLEILAAETGGEYIRTPNAGQLAAIYADWAQTIFQCFRRCTLRYESRCADGGQRDLVLRLPGLCGKGAAATGAFTAPGDTIGRPFLPMRLSSTHSMARRDITVQLSLAQQVEHTNLYPSQLRLRYDTASLELRKVDVPAVSLIRGVRWSWQQGPGLVQIQTLDPALMHGSGELFELTFRTRDTEDTLCSQVALDTWTGAEGCLQPAVAAGEVCVYPWRDEPLVSCDVSPSVTLGWRPARQDYVPSPFTVFARFDNNGSTTAKNGMFVVEYDRASLRRVRPDHDTIMYSAADVVPGSHAAVAWDFEALHRGDAATVPVCIRAQFDNHPDVFCCSGVEVPAAGPVLLCSVAAPVISAIPNRGEYDPMPFPVTVTVTNTGRSAADSVRLRLVVPPDLALYSGEPEVKMLNPFRLDPQAQGTLHWMLAHGPTPLRRQYVVEAWAFSPGADSTRCEVVVTIPALEVLDFRVLLQRSGPLEFCEGESVTLNPGTGYDRYEWSNGDSTRLLTVRASGTYSCVLFLGG
ncbi:MAG: VWA domain-containing protein, partial [Bacteroidetes bacterium]|nr:VWA domain-containing protein [Bacteroidota bacterium]